MLNHSGITSEEVSFINNSNGIICSKATYGHNYLRFGYIPS